MSRPVYTVACLARHGVGPEVMAAASRAVDAASALHGFRVDEHHVPFGAEALMRFGQPFPLSSRRAVLAADAVLVASVGDETLLELESELDLRASVVRVRVDDRSAPLLFAPCDSSWAWTVGRAASAARASRGRVTLVGVDERWNAAAEQLEDDPRGLDVERLEPEHAMRALVVAPSRFDVVVCPPELLASAAEVAGCLVPGRRASAWGRLARSGPGVFGVSHGPEEELAGHGVADPSSMLLAASLLLGEGLGERSAAATLLASVGSAHALRTPPSGVGVAELLVAQLQLTVSNSELSAPRPAREVA
jgi:isocitrate/isopropylmalate dehydrogenase